MKNITVTIDEDGNSSVDLSGFTGKACDKVMAELAGDNKLIRSTNKPEYFEQTKQEQKA